MPHSNGFQMTARRERVQKRLFLFGHFGSLNLGNEATLQALIHNVRLLAPNVTLECICNNPKVVTKWHGIHGVQISRRFVHTSHQDSRSTALPLFFRRWLRRAFLQIPYEILEWGRAIRTLKGSASLVMAGTGMLTDSGEGALGLPYELFKWALAAKLCRVPLSFLSVGVEPIRLRLTSFFIRSSLRMADFVSFRDQHSEDSIRKFGYIGRSVVLPDLAFSLPENVIPVPTVNLSRKPVVAVGLYDYERRGTLEKESMRRYSEYIRQLSLFVVWLVRRGHPVRVIIGDILYDNPVREDFCNSLKRMGINYTACGITDEPISSVADLLGQIASTDMVVATRYHNLVFALLLGKPAISIAYEKKNDALMTAVGLSDYCQTLDRLDLDLLKEQFLKLDKSAPRVIATIRERTNYFRHTLLARYPEIFGKELIKTQRV